MNALAILLQDVHHLLIAGTALVFQIPQSLCNVSLITIVGRTAPVVA